MMRNSKITIPMLSLAAVLLISGYVFGNSNDMNTFTAYNTLNQVLNSCTVCHTSGSSLNPYGSAYLNAGRNDNALRSIASVDSDGDNFSNSAEITAGTFPGNAASRPTTAGDTTPPSVTAFSLPATATSLTVSIPAASLTATDNVGVTSYCLAESTTPPTTSTPTCWTATKPGSYTFANAGTKTLYAWARDLAGNVSNSLSGTVTITAGSEVDLESPEVMEFTLPLTSTSLTVPILAFRAIDNVDATAYLITTTPAAPAANATGWSATPRTSYTFTSGGAKTLYGWAKDAAGNVSESLWDNVDITASSGLPDISVKTSLDFEGVGVNENKGKELKVTNQGKATLAVTKVEVIGTDAAAFKPSAASFNVNPSVEYKLRINFKPTAQRSYRATLRIHSNDPDTPVKEVALTGVGTR